MIGEWLEAVSCSAYAVDVAARGVDAVDIVIGIVAVDAVHIAIGIVVHAV